MNRSKAGLMCLALGFSALAFGQAASPRSGIYSCVDANGKKITSDRPIADCASREQRELNPDGSVRRVVPPTPTLEERSAIEAREVEQAADRARQREAILRDRNLMARFPNQAAHQKAREAALEDVRKSVVTSESRLAVLLRERKPLLDEAEFYVGKPLPVALKTRLDANEASADALRSLLQNQKLEVVRINTRYDAELERLRSLWSGARPGSMGVLAGDPASAPPRK